MPIYKIDQVNINGKNQAFGGYIYNIDVDIGLVDAPTKITVSFINSKGQYLEPELSPTKAYRIEIGNILSGNYYAVSRDFVNAVGQKVLKVEFVDGSIALNRIWVGLYKRHGDDKTNIPGLLIVGREMHPCDVNEDGIFDGKDYVDLALKGFDPCELRCPSDTSTREPIIEDCIHKEITEIFEIKYNFQDLLQAIQGNVPKSQPRSVINVPIDVEAGLTSTVPIQLPDSPTLSINKSNTIRVNNMPKNINLNYYASYTGKLRDVLKSWCSDFGWSFFWEDDALNFVDTRQRIEPIHPSFDNLQSVGDHRSIEGTIARGFISQYLEPGIIAKQECQESRPYTLKCLTLADLFGGFYKPVWSAVADAQSDFSAGNDIFSALGSLPDPSNANDATNQIEYWDDFYDQGVPIDKFETSCVLAHYGESLRHLYTLWEYYGIKNANKAEQAKLKWMDRLGQMKILNVLASTASGIYKEKYDLLLNGTFRGTKNKLFSDIQVAKIQQNQGYFVVAVRNRAQTQPDLLDFQYRIEEGLATNFLGRHWQRAYVAPFIGETPQITPNGQYFGALATNVKDLPFANFGHSYKSPVGKMVSSFIQRQRNDFRQYGMLRFTQRYDENTTTKLVRSILYLQKETADRWNPLKNTRTALDATVQDLKNFMFQRVDISQFDNQAKKALVTDSDGKQLIQDKDLDKVELYIFYPGSLPVTTDFVNNDYEENPTYTESNQPFGLAQVGLSDKKCLRYTVMGIPIFTPAAASVQFNLQPKFKWLEREPQVKEFSTPTYKVFVTNTAKNRGIINKAEAVIIEAPELEGTMETDFMVKQLTTDSTRFLSKLNKLCRVPEKDLQAIHTKLAKNLNYSVKTPNVSRCYRMMGLKLPNKASIKDGLEKVHISIDSDGGIFTDITIGNSLFTPPNPSVTEQILERAAVASYWKNRKNPLR